MQPSGGGPDHKAFWVKKSSCPRNVVQLRCHGAPRFVHSSACRALCGFSGSSFQLCEYIRLVAIYQTSRVSSQITAQAFSVSTSPFVHISINQFTTFQYIVRVHTVCAHCLLHTHLFSTKTLLIPGQLRWTRATWQKS